MGLHCSKLLTCTDYTNPTSRSKNPPTPCSKPSSQPSSLKAMTSQVANEGSHSKLAACTIKMRNPTDRASLLLNQKIAAISGRKHLPKVRANSFDEINPLPINEIIEEDSINQKLPNKGHLDYRAGNSFLSMHSADTVTSADASEPQGIHFKPLMPNSVESATNRLSDNHRTVMKIFTAYAAVHSREAYPKLLERVQSLGYTENHLQVLLNRIYCSDVVIRLNPNKQVGGGLSVMQRLLKDTHYRNLFEVGISNGNSNTEVRSGWEKKIFHNHYERCFGQNIQPKDRPKYGTLNIFDRPRGDGHSQYGEVVLVLKPAHGRITLCYGDSCRARNTTLGTPMHCAHTVNALSDKQLSTLFRAAKYSHSTQPLSTIGNIFEVQIHGDLLLSHDIAVIRAPKSMWSMQGKTLGSLCVKCKAIPETSGGPYTAVMERYYRLQESKTLEIVNGV